MDFSNSASEPVVQPNRAIDVVRRPYVLVGLAKNPGPFWRPSLGGVPELRSQPASRPRGPNAVTKENTRELAAVADRMRCRACGSKAGELRAATPVPEYLA